MLVTTDIVNNKIRSLPPREVGDVSHLFHTTKSEGIGKQNLVKTIESKIDTSYNNSRGMYDYSMMLLMCLS